MEENSDTEMSLCDAVLPFVCALSSPPMLGSEMGFPPSPSVTRLAPRNRRGSLAGALAGASRSSHGIPPVLARVWRGLMKLYLGILKIFAKKLKNLGNLKNRKIGNLEIEKAVLRGQVPNLPTSILSVATGRQSF